ncbi:hypothetical protein N9D37_00975 [Erythrobacter sp.]|nr:hypothetical protein [Erythrobacter sp.]
MKKYLRLAAAVPLSLASQASAQELSSAVISDLPRLICTMDDAPTWVIRIQLDERRGVVTFQFPWNQHPLTKPASFGADAIYFNGMEIDRRTLKLKNDFGPMSHPDFRHSAGIATCVLDRSERSI